MLFSVAVNAHCDMAAILAEGTLEEGTGAPGHHVFVWDADLRPFLGIGATGNSVQLNWLDATNGLLLQWASHTGSQWSNITSGIMQSGNTRSYSTLATPGTPARLYRLQRR